jgi:hypothetical protein
MAKKAKLVAPERPEIGEAMAQSANVLAQEINNPLMVDIELLNKAKQDWEGGPFVVLNRLTSIMSKEKLDALPDPKSDTGNNPAKYLLKKVRTNSKGKTVVEWKEHYYYSDLALSLPGIVAKQQQKLQLERSLDKQANQDGVPVNYRDMSIEYRNALITKLNGEISGAVRSVSLAFELLFQLKHFNEDLDTVYAKPIYAMGSDGKLMDGQDGRPFQVEATKQPIFICTTIEERKGLDYDYLSIGRFLDIDIPKAIENGGTYGAAMHTITRQKPTDNVPGNAQDQSRPQAINTADTAIARIVDVAEYTTRAMEARDKAAWEQLKKELSGAGSDEAFLSARDLLQALTVLVGSPADAARDAKIRGEQDEEAA